MTDRAGAGTARPLLDGLENIGGGSAFAEQIFALVGRSPFFAEFDRDDIRVLSGHMQIYHAQPGQPIIREGDVGDYMLLVIRGEVDIYKKNLHGVEQHMSSVVAGVTLGEMSMIDGEPRFATCIAQKECTFGVLTRENMIKIVHEKPGLGAKILVRLVTMLAQRVREIGAKLLHYMT